MDLDGKIKKYTLPTIQSLSIPDKSKVPSKPTVTGQYRQQHTVEVATTVSFTIFLENGKFRGELVDVSEMVDLFDYLKKNRISFNITTSHSGEEARFLHDLVVESVSYSRDKNVRGRLVCTLDCTKLQMVELVWEKVDAVEMFGYNIVTAAGSEKAESRDFKLGPAEELKIRSTKIGEIVDSLKKIYGSVVTSTSMEKQTPVSERVGNFVAEKKILGNVDCYYAYLTTHIDMRGKSNKKYNCKSTFRTTRGNSGTGYTATLANIGIDVRIDDAVGVINEIPMIQVISSQVLAAVKSTGDNRADGMFLVATPPNVAFRNSTRYVYNFAETYPAFPGGRSFEYIEEIGSISEYLAGPGIVFSKDMTLLGSGTIIHDSGYIKTYPINQKYDVTLKCANWQSPAMEPTGGFDLYHYKINTVEHGYKPSFGEMQDVWDAAVTSNKVVNYELHIVVAFLGSMMQVYLFSPNILLEGQVAY